MNITYVWLTFYVNVLINVLINLLFFIPGRIGITLTAPWIIAETESSKDKYAANVITQFTVSIIWIIL